VNSFFHPGPQGFGRRREGFEALVVAEETRRGIVAIMAHSMRKVPLKPNLSTSGRRLSFGKKKARCRPAFIQGRVTPGYGNSGEMMPSSNTADRGLIHGQEQIEAHAPAFRDRWGPARRVRSRGVDTRIT